jgi:hypothetical protein
MDYQGNGAQGWALLAPTSCQWITECAGSRIGDVDDFFCGSAWQYRTKIRVV